MIELYYEYIRKYACNYMLLLHIIVALGRNKNSRILMRRIEI